MHLDAKFYATRVYATGDPPFMHLGAFDLCIWEPEVLRLRGHLKPRCQPGQSSTAYCTRVSGED